MGWMDNGNGNGKENGQRENWGICFRGRLDSGCDQQCTRSECLTSARSAKIKDPDISGTTESTLERTKGLLSGNSPIVRLCSI